MCKLNCKFGNIEFQKLVFGCKCCHQTTEYVHISSVRQSTSACMTIQSFCIGCLKPSYSIANEILTYNDHVTAWMNRSVIEIIIYFISA